MLLSNSFRKVSREQPGQGNDTVQSSVSYTLGANIENLVLTGVANINGAGNTLDNQITGNNLLTGGTGNDTINGGDGDDSVFSGADSDVIDAGLGADTVNGGDGDDTIKGGDGNDTINGNIGADSITGGDGDDTILGGDGGDLIDAGLGADAVNGGSGNDTILGADGDDLITGGANQDSLSGGLGNDVFIFTSLTDSTAAAVTADIITDFGTALDQIDLSAIDANSLVAGNQAFTFGGLFTVGHIRAVQSGADTLIQINTDNDPQAEMTIKLLNILAANITVGDFIL